jgi:DNA-binding NarL/FixJ family response regulator
VLQYSQARYTHSGQIQNQSPPQTYRHKLLYVRYVVAIITFLLVDDTDSYRAILRQFVQTQPHWSIIGEASDGVEAVQLAISLIPDVVFMDVMLPRMNGIEATRRIKQQLQSTRIVVFSGHDEDEFRRESLIAGADYYLRKEDLDPGFLKQLIVQIFPGRAAPDDQNEHLR